MPNTWPILCHCETVTTRSLPAPFTTGRSQTTRPTSPRHSYTDSSPGLSVATVSATTCRAPQACPRQQTSRLFVSAYFTNSGSASHMPPTDPCFPDFPKTNPREVRPTLSNESTSRQHKSSQVERLGSLRDLATLRLPRNRIDLIALLVFESTFLGCAHLFSYRDCKGRHRE